MVTVMVIFVVDPESITSVQSVLMNLSEVSPEAATVTNSSSLGRRAICHGQASVCSYSSWC